MFASQPPSPSLFFSLQRALPHQMFWSSSAFRLSVPLLDLLHILNSLLFSTTNFSTSPFYHQVSLCLCLPLVFPHTSTATPKKHSSSLFHISSTLLSTSAGLFANLSLTPSSKVKRIFGYLNFHTLHRGTNISFFFLCTFSLEWSMPTSSLCCCNDGSPCITVTFCTVLRKMRNFVIYLVNIATVDEKVKSLIGNRGHSFRIRHFQQLMTSSSDCSIDDVTSGMWTNANYRKTDPRMHWWALTQRVRWASFLFHACMGWTVPLIKFLHSFRSCAHSVLRPKDCRSCFTHSAQVFRPLPLLFCPIIS